MRLPLFCQHLILGFDSRQRKECKEFPELLFYLLSSYLSSTKLYSSSPPWAFQEAKQSSVLNNFDFNEKRAFLLSVKILLLLEISGLQWFRENLGFVKILVKPSLLFRLLQKGMGIHQDSHSVVSF